MAVTMSKKSGLIAKIDFSDVKDPSPFSRRHVPAGEYKAKVTGVEHQQSKRDQGDMWVFEIKLTDVPGAVYPHYCKLQANQLWKIHQLGHATGLELGKSVKTVNAEKFIGRELGVVMDDDEYDGRLQSTIIKCIPISEVDGPGDITDDHTDDDGDDGDDDGLDLDDL